MRTKHKICPQCGQPNTLALRVCNYCNHNHHGDFNPILKSLINKFGSQAKLAKAIKVSPSRFGKWCIGQLPKHISMNHEILFCQVTGFLFQEVFPQYDDEIPLSNHEEFSDEIPCNLPPPDIQLEDIEIESLRQIALEIALNSLRKRRLKVILGVHDGLIYKEIAAQINVSRERIRQIYWHSIEEVQEHSSIRRFLLAEEGVPGNLINARAERTNDLFEYYKEVFSKKSEVKRIKWRLHRREKEKKRRKRWKKEMKVLFLDVDGVLNRISDLSENPITVNDDLIRIVKRIIDETQAIIVLSSSWRNYPECVELLENKLQSFGLSIRGFTPNLFRPRSYEIRKWLKSSFVKAKIVKAFAIVDDDSSAEIEGHFFQTDPRVGITEEIADKIIRHLTPTDKHP